MLAFHMKNRNLFKIVLKDFHEKFQGEFASKKEIRGQGERKCAFTKKVICVIFVTTSHSPRNM